MTTRGMQTEEDVRIGLEVCQKHIPKLQEVAKQSGSVYGEMAIEYLAIAKALQWVLGERQFLFYYPGLEETK